MKQLNNSMKNLIFSATIPEITGRHVQACLLLSVVSFFSPLPVWATASVPLPDGGTLYHKYCSVCHAISAPATNAPPIKTISGLYRRKYQQKSEGVAAIVAFIKLPSVKNALDQAAISKYGLMSRVPASSKEREVIGEWLWDQAGLGVIPLKNR